MKPKVFISQAMAGKSNEDIYKERLVTVDMFEALGYEVIDSILGPEDLVRDNRYPANMSVAYLAESLRLMADADLVFFIGKGSSTGRGCEIERQVADAYGIPWAYGSDISRAGKEEGDYITFPIYYRSKDGLGVTRTEGGFVPKKTPEDK